MREDDPPLFMRDQQLIFFHLFELIEDGGCFIMENTQTSDQEGYDVLPDKSNSTKKMFECIQQQNILSSFYINDKLKCEEIISKIKYIQHFEINQKSQTTFIFKK